MATSKADRQVLFIIKHLKTHKAGQEFCPLWSLHRHLCAVNPEREKTICLKLQNIWKICSQFYPSWYCRQDISPDVTSSTAVYTQFSIYSTVPSHNQCFSTILYLCDQPEKRLKQKKRDEYEKCSIYICNFHREIQYNFFMKMSLLGRFVFCLIIISWSVCYSRYRQC